MIELYSNREIDEMLMKLELRLAGSYVQRDELKAYIKQLQDLKRELHRLIAELNMGVKHDDI